MPSCPVRLLGQASSHVHTCGLLARVSCPLLLSPALCLTWACELFDQWDAQQWDMSGAL